MTDVRVIAMPYELAWLRDGVGRGPERLLERGVADALGAQRTEVIELDGERRNETAACFELIRMVSAHVKAAVNDGAFPVVLSGSCYAAVGVVAGLGESAPGVVWLDAHPDFNTTDSSPTGYFDGMGLTILAGRAWQELLGTVPGATTVPETAIVLGGARAIDEPEGRVLESSALAQVPPDGADFADRLRDAVQSMTPAPSGLYLHVDLDVLDTSEAQVNAYSAPGGITAEELEAAVRAVVAAGSVRALSMTAYDPLVDVNDAVPPIADRLAGVMAEHLAEN